MHPLLRRYLIHWVLAVVWIPAFASAESEAGADAKKLAREHFERGVAAFSDSRFAEAAREFNAAYEISHAYVVLYNIGQVNAALGNAVASVDAFQTYLEQGGTTVPDQRRAAVQAELERQRALIGTIAVHARPEGASVHVDGKAVGAVPLSQPVRVTAGVHSIVVMMDGYQAQARELQVGAGAKIEVDLELQTAQATAAPSQSAATSVVVSAPGTRPSAPTPATASVQVPHQPTPAHSGHQRTAGYVLCGLGVVVVGVGSYVNLMALADASDAKDRGDPEAFNAAKTHNYWGWGAIAVGAVAATTGAVLIVTAPSSSSVQGLRLTPFSDGYAHGFSVASLW